MRYTLLALAASAPLVFAAPSPYTPVANLPFPSNATVVHTPPPSEDATGTAIHLQGQNPRDGTNFTLAAPFTPAGGDVQNTPIYKEASNFDFQSLNLALNQELFELDLFNYGLATFSPAQFAAAGVNQAGVDLIRFMASQEIGHAEVLRTLIGPDVAARQCIYQYPFTSVAQFIQFAQIVTRVGESGVLGFLPHLNSRPSAELLLTAIATEGRQELILRQFQGLFPMPVWVEPAITQSMAWTILSQYIHSCPKNNPKVLWQNFPGLNVLNNPVVTNPPAITTDEVPTAPGREINLVWEAPGRSVGPDLAYKTSTSAKCAPKYAAFIGQSVVYADLYNIKSNSASVKQPGDLLVPGDVSINGTVFIAIVDEKLPVTPYNLTLLNDHILAGPTVYQA